MFTALVTFLGGATFRLFLGHVFDFIVKWQDQTNELARLRLQGELEAAAHTRQLEMLKLQADLGIKTIEAQATAHTAAAEDDAFVQVIKTAATQTEIGRAHV